MRKTMLWMACCVLLGCSAELDGLANGSSTGGSTDPITPVEPTDPDPRVDGGTPDAGAPVPPGADAGPTVDAGSGQDAAPMPPGGDEDASEPMPPEPDPDSGTPPPDPVFVLTSTTISEGGTFPVDHTCDGKNQSPALMWTGAPSGTLSYAVVITDLDGAGGGGSTGGSTTGGSSTGGSSGGNTTGSSGGSGGSSTGASSGGTSGSSSGTSSGNGTGSNTGTNNGGTSGNSGNGNGNTGSNNGNTGSNNGNTGSNNGNGPGSNTGSNNGNGNGANSGMTSSGPGGNSGATSNGPRGFDDVEFTQGYGSADFAQASGFAQWVIWDVAAANSQLPQNIARGVLPANVPGAKQVRGLAPLGVIGGGTYAGPCPGRRVTHRYEFKLYALGVALLPGASTSARPADIVSLIESRGSVLGTATLSSSYTGE